MKKEQEPKSQKGVSRRDFSRIAATFGLTSTMLAYGGLARAGLAPDTVQLAQKADETAKDRSKVTPKVRLKYGLAGHDIESTWVAKVGTYDFIYDIEERTDYAIQVEAMAAHSVCGEMTCAEKCIQGIVDLYVTSTNNASTTCPYLNILDFGALWPSRASLYSFAVDCRSEELWREPMRRQYGIEMLFGDYGLRGFFMSKMKYGEGTPAIDTLEKLRATGAKLRTTGTLFGLKSMQLMGVNPVATSYEEVLDAMRRGAIDGAEAWEIPFSAIHFTEFTGQYLYLKYCSGNWVTGMNVNSFEKMPSELRDALMESAYLAQVATLGKEEASIWMKAGSGECNPPPPSTEHWRADIRNIQWSREEMLKLEKLISPLHNPDPWKEWMEKLNKIYGRGDIFEKMYAIAHEVPANAYAIDIFPKRWWKPNPPWWNDPLAAPWRRGVGYFGRTMDKKVKLVG
ncbi:MAG: TRAP transporter substrate-binding protein [Syntrophobacteraceae bacterium]